METRVNRFAALADDNGEQQAISRTRKRNQRRQAARKAFAASTPERNEAIVQERSEARPNDAKSSTVEHTDLERIQTDENVTLHTEQQMRSRLLELPPELRNRIWEEVLGTSGQVVIYQCVERRASLHHGWEEEYCTMPPRLLSVCRQIRYEARMMYFKHITFRFAFHFTCKGTAGFEYLYRWLQSIGPEACTILQRIDIELSPSMNDSSVIWEPRGGEYLIDVFFDDRTCSLDPSALRFPVVYHAVTYSASGTVRSLQDSLGSWAGEVCSAARIMKQTDGRYTDSSFDRLVENLREMEARRTVESLRCRVFPTHSRNTIDGSETQRRWFAQDVSPLLLLGVVIVGLAVVADVVMMMTGC